MNRRKLLTAALVLGVWAALVFTGCLLDLGVPRRNDGQQSQPAGGVLTVKGVKNGTHHEAAVYDYPDDDIADAADLIDLMSRFELVAVGLGTAGNKTLALGLVTLDGDYFTADGDFLVVITKVTKDDSAPFKYKAAVPFSGGNATLLKYSTLKTAIRIYTVTFDLNYTDAPNPPKPQEIDAGGKVTQPSVPTLEGYTFGGWFTDAAGTGAAWDFGTDTVKKDVTLYAKWAHSYTVTYDLNYTGSANPPPNQEIGEGGNATQPAVPARTGYTFGGWFTDAAGTEAEWNFDLNTVKETITLYAKWTQITYTVTFYWNYTGTTEPYLVSTPVAHGGTITEPTTEPERTGWTFGGWFLDEAGTEAAWDFDTDTVTEDTTLYAKWNINSYAVTFVTDAEPTAAPVNVNYNELVPQPPAMTKTGYTFDGWYKTNSRTAEKWNFATNRIGAENINLYGFWDINSYTVTFVTDTAPNADPQTRTLDYGSAVPPPTMPPKTGYTFNGWYKTNSKTAAKWNFAADSIGAGNINLYGFWDINQYTVSFNTAGGTSVSNQTVAHGGKAAEPSTSKTGHTLDGWYTEASYATRWVFNTNTITANRTLYAKWTPVYTVTFNLNYQGAPAGQTQSVKQGDRAIAPAAPQRTGFTFGNWYTEAACTTQWNFNNTITANRTLYAKWTPVYTVTFNLNYQGAPAAQTLLVAPGARLVELSSPQRTGYSFGGWFTEAACTTRWNFNNTITENRPLYAKWTPVIYKVTMHRNGGYWEGAAGTFLATHNGPLPAVIGRDTYTAAYNTVFAIPDAPIIREGYSFQGWHTDSQLTNRVTSVHVTGNMTLYAKWQKEANVTVTLRMGVLRSSDTGIRHGYDYDVPYGGRLVDVPIDTAMAYNVTDYSKQEAPPTVKQYSSNYVAAANGNRIALSFPGVRENRLKYYEYGTSGNRRFYWGDRFYSNTLLWGAKMWQGWTLGETTNLYKGLPPVSGWDKDFP
jgi:uncharacterized repeat protein (TIGR02543 family)